MRRRDFIKVIAGSAAVWPLVVRARQPSMPIVGFLSGTSPDDRAVAFRQGLNEGGFLVDRNVAIEYRWAQGESDPLPELVADLLGLQPAVIVVAGSTAGAVAAKAA